MDFRYFLAIVLASALLLSCCDARAMPEKWMCVILPSVGERTMKEMSSLEECLLWRHQQYYSPQYPIAAGPVVISCEPYWEA